MAPPININLSGPPQTAYTANQRYANCSQYRGMTNLQLLGTAAAGNRRLNIDALRCMLLFEDRSDLASRRVLELEKYFDCVMPVPPDADVLREAMKYWGADRNPSFLDSILSAMEDDAQARSSSGFENFKALVRALGTDSWPRQGSAERAALDSINKLNLDLGDALIKLITGIVPAGESLAKVFGFLGDAQQVSKVLIDMLFAIGDYAAEVAAVRKEIAVRLLSTSPVVNPIHPYGMGRVQTMRGAYKAVNPGGPSAKTIAAWCEEGRKRSLPYFSPDGTNGKFYPDLVEWNAVETIVNENWRLFRDSFRGDWQKLIAVTAMRAAIYGAYTFDDALKISVYIDESQFGGPSRQDKNVGVLFQSKPGIRFGDVAVTCGEPRNAWEAADTLQFPDPTGVACKFNYFTPFWEDVTSGDLIDLSANWEWKGRPYPTGDSRSAVDFKKKIIDILDGRYFKVGSRSVIVPRTARSFETISVPAIVEMSSAQAFAADYARGWGVLKKWVEKAYPYKGPKTQLRLVVQRLLGDGIPGYYGIWPYLLSALQTGWYGAIIPGWSADPAANARIPEEVIWRSVLRFIMFGQPIGRQPVRPVITDPKYKGVAAPCPDGTTKCLPCETIRGRRPVGAKALRLPKVIEWSGSNGKKGSPEYLAWRKLLTDGGYPDYYVDCLEREVQFVAKPGAFEPFVGFVQVPTLTLMEPQLSAPSPTSSRNTPMAGFQPNQLRLAASRDVGGWAHGTSGIRAPTVALLTGTRLGARPVIEGEFQTEPRELTLLEDPVKDALVDAERKARELADEAAYKAKTLPTPVKVGLAIGAGLLVVKLLSK